MSVSVEQSGAVGRRLTITIPGKNLETEINQRLAELAKSAKIKGFRPGKAPANIVRREYGSAVREDVINALMRSHYGEAVKSESLEPVDAPSFNAGGLGEDGNFTFTADLEVYPQFEPAGTDALTLERPQITIGDEAVDVVMERLRAQKQNWAAVERPARDGDRVTVNFEGRVDGEPFEGNRGENVPVIIGANEMIPGFEAGLEDVSVGETRTLTLTFPEGHRSSDLVGRPVSFEVTALSVEEREVPALDGDFAAAFGCAEGGVEELRARVRENMGNELATRVREDMQRQVGSQLVEANSIEVPQALVDREIERRQREVLRRLGFNSDETRRPDLPREPYEEDALRHVRLGLILTRLIRDEELRPDPARIAEHVERLCASLEDSAAAAREVRADTRAMTNIEAIVLEDMIYERLIEQAEINEVPRDFLDYMEPKESETTTESASNE